MKENRSAFKSEEYDRKINQTLPYYMEIHREIVNLAAMAAANPVHWLDVGCGTGQMAEVLQNRLAVEYFVFCDESEAMIDLVKSKHFPGFLRTEFVNRPVQELGYQDAFDVITAVLVNHYANGAKRAETMKTCFQALKPGGIYITVDNFAPEFSQSRELYLKRWREYQISQGRTPDEAKKHLDRYGISYFPITISKQLELMKVCGFCTAEVFWLSNMQVGVFGIK